MILFHRFSWQFAEASAPTLQNVSLHVHRGEFVVIAGPSGSGKTTLALAMCGLLIARHAGENEGCVRVHGQDVAMTPLHRLAQSIGLVQQNPDSHFATLTVGDEVAFGMENRCVALATIQRRSTDAMELLGIAHLRDRNLSTLSGGEKQRVAIASIIAGDPEAIVLDEPTASLDAEASRELFRYLADLHTRTGLTVVIIEHKLADLMPLKPRLICMERGEIVRDGAGETAGHSILARHAAPERVPAFERPFDSGPRSTDVVAELSGVTVVRDGNKVLDGVSLTVNAGEVIAILGPNGSGKTTLLECLHGLLPFTSGTARVCGMDVSQTAVSRLARSVGFVFQNADHQLVADTVWQESIFTSRSLGELETSRERQAGRLIEQAGISNRKKDHPFRLSWGEKRRLNLISVILHQPRLLLLDEPFAGQDWENALFLLGVIREVLGGTPVTGAAETGNDVHGPHGACLLVTHDPRIVQRICARLVFLSKGRVILDAPLPQAFDKLLSLGHDAYVPTEFRRLPAGHAAGTQS
jgi:energy-coupling factor transporter ATP-binding protein EcfA2